MLAVLLKQSFQICASPPVHTKIISCQSVADRSKYMKTVSAEPYFIFQTVKEFCDSFTKRLVLPVLVATTVILFIVGGREGGNTSVILFSTLTSSLLHYSAITQWSWRLQKRELFYFTFNHFCCYQWQLRLELLQKLRL